jgi:phage-related protein
MAVGSSTDIGIRVFLDDVASAGLYNINSALGRIGSNALAASGAFRGLSANLVTVGVLMGAGAAFLAFGSAIMWTVKQASMFEDAVAEIQINVRGATGPALQELANNMMRVADASIYSDTQIAQGVSRLGVLGITAQQMNAEGGKLIQTMTDLGEAIGTDPVNAAQLLGSTMRMFGLSADQATMAANALDFAFKNGQPSVSDLTESMRQVAPLAHAMGFSLDDVSLALAFFGQSGLQGSVGGTALRYMLQNLQNPTAKAADALQQLGFYTVNATPALSNLLGVMDAQGGAAKKAADAYDGTVSSLQSVFKAAQTAGIIPLNTTFMQWATSTKTFSNALYDSQGNVRSMKDVINSLLDGLKGMNPQEAANAISQVFGARAGQAALQLAGHIKDFNQVWAQLQQNLNNTSAMNDAQIKMNTLSGAWKEFSTTVSNIGVIIGGTIAPALTRITQGLNGFLSGLTQSAGGLRQAGPLFLGLGLGLSAVAVVGGIVAAAITGVGAALLAFIGIAGGMFVGIIALAAGITGLVIAIHNVSGSATPLGAFFRGLGGIFKDLGSYIGGAFQLAWKSIQQAIAPLGPAFAQLGSALHPFLPLVGALAVVLLMLLVGALHGVVMGLTMFISGLAHALVGVVLVLTGIITFVAGFAQLLAGIFTGNGARIQAGWRAMWNGIGQIANGILHIIVGVIVATFGTIIGFFGGFVHGVISFFQHLSSVLVGHSIVPDMMNAIRSIIIGGLQAVIGAIVSAVANIISHFTAMGSSIISTITGAFNSFKAAVSGGISAAISFVAGGAASMIGSVASLGSMVISTASNAWNGFRNAVANGVNSAMSFVSSLPGRIVGALAGLGSMLWSSGMNAMAQFGAGLSSAIGSVLGPIQNAASAVANFLGHHSPAKMGPLSDDDQWMPRMMKMFASGINENVPLLQQAASRAAGGIASAPSTSRLGTPTGTTVGGGSATGGNQTINLVLDGRVVTQVVLNNLTGQMQMNGLGRAFR